MYNSDELRLFSQKANLGLCSHAYIVDGDSGIGKLDFALECARALLCTEQKKPCGYCTSCRKLLSGEHPDVYIIGRDKAAAIADVRELIRRSFLKPNDSDKQVFIVNNAGKLREDSQNALLKLFEEPPETVTIFLLTESRASLLPTVLSRGQRIHLDGLRDSEIEELLRERYSELKSKELRQTVEKAGGNLGNALRWLSKENSATRAKAEKLLLHALSKQNYELAGALLLPKYKREQITAILLEFILLLNEAQKQKYGVEEATLPEDPELNAKISGASKRALAKMSEAAFSCMSALDNNANITAATSKLTIELCAAATR